MGRSLRVERASLSVCAIAWNAPFALSRCMSAHGARVSVWLAHGARMHGIRLRSVGASVLVRLLAPTGTSNAHMDGHLLTSDLGAFLVHRRAFSNSIHA